MRSPWRNPMLLLAAGALCAFHAACAREPESGGKNTVKLPAPIRKGTLSVEEAIFRRRSIRNFRDAPLTLAEVSQLLWATGGKTSDGVTGATRAYPSAGGIYPLEIYLVAGNVEGLDPAVYRYDWRNHTLNRLKEGDYRNRLALAALGQGMVAKAPASIVLTGLYPKATRKYGKRGADRYLPMDAGHAGENVHLQAEALGLGTVMVGAFMDAGVKGVLGCGEETPVYIMPVGRPQSP